MIFHALGNVDELNSSLGIAREHCVLAGNGLDEKYGLIIFPQSFLIFVFRLTEIQSRLFDLGAAIATPISNSSEEKKKYTEVLQIVFIFLFEV